MLSSVVHSVHTVNYCLVQHNNGWQESDERVSGGDCKQLRQFNGAAPECAKNALAMA